jgi:hypothetical protein
MVVVHDSLTPLRGGGALSTGSPHPVPLLLPVVLWLLELDRDQP